LVLGGAISEVVSQLITQPQQRVVEVLLLASVFAYYHQPLHDNPLARLILRIFMTMLSQVDVHSHDLASSQIMQMFDIKGGSKVRGGFSILKIVRYSLCNPQLVIVTASSGANRERRSPQ
jgi:hypothetical protein